MVMILLESFELSKNQVYNCQRIKFIIATHQKVKQEPHRKTLSTEVYILLIDKNFTQKYFTLEMVRLNVPHFATFTTQTLL